MFENRSMGRLTYMLIFFVFSFLPKNLQSQHSMYEVYIFMHESCKICQYYTPTLKNIFDKYNGEKFRFVGVFPNAYSKKNERILFQKKHQIPFKLVPDRNQHLMLKFGVEITPEVVVYNRKKDEVIYKGRIDNSYVKVGDRRRVVTSFELEKVLEGILEGRVEPVQNMPAIGCFIEKTSNPYLEKLRIKDFVPLTPK